jgi:SAM-dependent methyltransferase
MTDPPREYRLYRDLAGWWPLISPVEEYTEEAAWLTTVLDSAPTAVRQVLDLGSGGGHLAVHLKGRFALTLVDRSQEMLAVSRALNPECVHRQGDMRTIRLGRAFDAVLVHDAVDYMTFAHCRPGGIALFVPDHVAETFRAHRGQGGGDDASGRQARFRERTWDPDPADTWVQAEYEFVLQEADGTVEVVQEAHRLGLFGRDTWLRLLTDAGFEADAGAELESGPGPDEDGQHNLFTGLRPAEPRPVGSPG